MTSEWKNIRRLLRRSVRSNLHVSIASVLPDGTPTVTPIGSLFLNRDQTGYYFEKYASSLANNRAPQKTICVLMVNSHLWFWVKALFRRKFVSFPGIKLYGTVGSRRKATLGEVQKLKKRTQPFSLFKGHDYLWGDMEFVRDIHFTHYDKISLGKMTEDIQQ